MTMPELQSDWHVEISQHRPKDSAQVYQILLVRGGVWGRDYKNASCAWSHLLVII